MMGSGAGTQQWPGLSVSWAHSQWPWDAFPSSLHSVLGGHLAKRTGNLDDLELLEPPKSFSPGWFPPASCIPDSVNTNSTTWRGHIVPHSSMSGGNPRLLWGHTALNQHGLSLQQSPDSPEYPPPTALHYPMAENLPTVKRGYETVWQLPRPQGTLICFKNIMF